MAHHDAPDPAPLLEHLDFARRLARSLVRDAGHADDLVQDAWVAALEHPPRDSGAGRAFLATLVHRLRARHLRGEERRTRREARAARPEAQASSAELAASMEVHRRVVEALMDLPELQRDALLLRFFEDMRPAAIARRLGVPVETVRTRVKRGLAGVRMRLESRGERDWIRALVVLGRSGAAAEPVGNGARRWLPRAALLAGALLASFGVFVIAGRLLTARQLYASADPRDETPDAAPEGAPVPSATGEREEEERPRYAALPREELEGVPSPGSVTAVRRAGYGTPRLVRSASLFGALFAGRQEDEAASLVQALGVELLDVLPLDPLSAEARARVARATDAPEEAVVAVRLFRAARLERDEPIPVRIARVPLPNGLDGAAVLLAIQGEGRFLANAVVDGQGRAIDDWEHFLQGFVWAEVPRLEGARPRSWLTAYRAEVEERDDEDARLTLALMRLMEQMNEQASVFNLPRDDRPLTPGEEFTMMARAYSEIAELTGELAPLLGDGGEEFARLALDSAASAEAFHAVYQAGDKEATGEIRRLIVNNCRACHELTSHPEGGMLKDASAALRRELGIGDGFYQVGHDLRIRHADRDAAQVVADALRLAALAIDAVP